MDKSNRYKISEENIMMVEIKKRIIQILHRIMDIQNDIRLTRFLMEVYKSDKELVMNPA